ncbi:MAG: large subunit ribosomal protein [Candidatus Peribacteria bacterium]|nr:large subunit ribosomal protein [Candidatus Peribacteria bacterium]
MTYDTLHHRLRGPIAEKLKKELKIDNLHALPRLDKITVNVGINKTKMDSKEMHEFIAETLKLITGQKPVFRETRKAISNFKTREGSVVGAVVTLRGQKMEAFLDRLVSYVFPRIRDFRGLSTKLDGHGNYAIGLKDHSIFPEVPPAETSKTFGLQIQLTIKGGDDEKSRALLREVGMPFVRKKEAKSVDQSENLSDTASPPLN